MHQWKSVKRAAMIGLLLGLALVATVVQASATPVIHLDEGMWNSAVAARTSLSATEVFDNTVLEPWLSIVSDQPGNIAAFMWQSVVDSSPLKTDTFRHSWTDVFAWCATFNLADPGGPGEGIKVYADLAGTDTLVGSMPGTYKNFWGFVLDNNDYFTYARLEGAAGAGTQETFWMDDLSIGADVPRIPEPATLVLLGTGLLALARRRKK